MQKNETNYLTYGSMMIALFAILLAMSVYVPFLSVIISFILPLPIAWYSTKFERKHALLVTLIAVVLSVLVGGIAGLFLGIALAPLGLIIGDAIRNKRSKFYILMASGIYLLFITAIQYIVFILVLNINILEQFFEALEISYKQAGNIMELTGQLPANYEEMVEQFLLLLKMIVPSLYIGIVYIYAFLYLVINLSLLKKLKLDVPKFSKFMDFRLPRVVLWYYLIVSIFSLFMEFEMGTFGYLLFVNAALILRVLLFLQGVSLIHYYFYVQGWPKWSMVLASILAVPLFTFTIILGVLDLGFNLRAYLKDRYKK
ncbi:YybS family protein [Psychrobacillus sp. NPDC093180]|uniref:YybS family protein n=1 Tax=Psychrobacillus sp. NPDC093180 TaxID=3364489 RepID=UPI00380D5CDD